MEKKIKYFCILQLFLNKLINTLLMLVGCYMASWAKEVVLTANQEESWAVQLLASIIEKNKKSWQWLTDTLD